jgi:hypothetical protein|tara:strand:- start:1379 stop:2518 length:1140 start_codon:yes stop_codon:yes gene_type:complete
VPKKIKKTRVSVTVAGNEVIQTFDGETLKEVYKGWKTEQSAIGNLHVQGANTPNNVLGLLEKHGVAGRGGVGNASDNTGAGSVIEVMDRILLKGNLIFENERIELLDIKEDLIYAEANNNPKDIPFRVPVLNSYNKALGKWDWETVRGHYRTPGYVQKRTLPTEEGGDGSEKEGPAAPAAFFNGQPPMWKALFGSNGLKKMTTELLDVIASSEVSIPLLNIRQAGTAELISKVDEVKEYITNKLFGKEFTKKDGTYNGVLGRNTLQTHQFKGDKQAKLIKMAAQIENIEGEIAGYKLNVTPLMMRKIAVSIGFTEAPTSPEETKEDKIGKSWKEILKARPSWTDPLKPKCPRCGSILLNMRGGYKKCPRPNCNYTEAKE